VDTGIGGMEPFDPTQRTMRDILRDLSHDVKGLVSDVGDLRYRVEHEVIGIPNGGDSPKGSLLAIRSRLDDDVARRLDEHLIAHKASRAYRTTVVTTLACGVVTAAVNITLKVLVGG
jgi:hypothetical protein